MGAEPVSGDEMSFDEVRYREPVRLLRPDRDRRYACLAYQVPALGDLPIFLDHRPADAIERHALSDTSVELGGILLGKECLDEATGAPFVWITQALEAKHYANTQASFTYTHDSWEEITRERDRLFPDLDIVGWYHTHPSFGIFLSHHDLFIHQHFFVQPLQVAYVVDPIQQTRGFFQWRNRDMAQVEGFYLTAERGDRIVLARLANDLENLPSPQGPGGGAFSPRLEAELIKMLTRQSSPQYVGSPVDRLQSAVMFSMLGCFLGMLAVAAALLLFQVHTRVQEQGDAIKLLTRAVEQTASDERLARDALLDRAGVDNATQFMQRYERAGKARDEARKQLLAQQAINETLGARTKELETVGEKLATDLAAANKTIEKYEADAKEAPELREKVASLRSELDKKTLLLQAADERTAGEVLQRLSLYRLTTILFAILSAILGVAAGYLYLKPVEELEQEQPAAEPEPHRIT
jgi:proteasome lid subunit RPN8/RPN11